MNSALTVADIDRAKTIANFAMFAGSHGLPLDTHLVVIIDGSPGSARNQLDDVCRILDGAGVVFTREVTARRQAVVVDIGAGVTYRVVHTSHDEPAGAAA